MKLGYLLLALVILTSTSFKSKLTVDEIIDKHTEAMGGAENLEKIKSVHCKYKSRIMITEIAVTEGKECLSRMNISGNEFVFYANDSIAKICSNGELKTMPDETSGQMINEINIFKLYKAKERRWNFELNKEKSSWKYFAIEGNNDDLNLKSTFYIYKKNFLIEKIVPSSGFRMEYKKYVLTADGVRYPSLTTIKRLPFTKAELTDLEFNKPLDELSTAFYAKCGGFN